MSDRWFITPLSEAKFYDRVVWVEASVPNELLNRSGATAPIMLLSSLLIQGSEPDLNLSVRCPEIHYTHHYQISGHGKCTSILQHLTSGRFRFSFVVINLRDHDFSDSVLLD